jgi:integrase
MKNPGQKIGNDVWCHLPPEALAILQTMPKVLPEISPYSAESVSTSWTRARQLLGVEDLHFHDLRLEIEDLHLHDLRHDGVSRLFEMDWDIPRVASVSGHRDWNSIRRYTHLRGRGDAYANWKWFETILKAPVKLGAKTLK